MGAEALSGLHRQDRHQHGRVVVACEAFEERAPQPDCLSKQGLQLTVLRIVQDELDQALVAVIRCLVVWPGLRAQWLARLQVVARLGLVTIGNAFEIRWARVGLAYQLAADEHLGRLVMQAPRLRRWQY